MVAIAAGLALSGCSPDGVSAGRDSKPAPDAIGVYASSEGGDQAYLVKHRTESFTTSRAWRRGDYPKLYDLTLVISQRPGFYYEPQFLFAVPLDRSADRWGDDDISCVAHRLNGAHVKTVECRFKQSDEASTFEFDDRRGVVSFESDCIGREGKCTFRLVQGDGLFASGFRLIEGQDRESDGTILLD